MPVEKPYVENGFEFLEALGEGGLADPQGSRCFRQAMLRTDGFDGPKMMKFQSLIEVSALDHVGIESGLSRGGRATEATGVKALISKDR
jgi:hypothetical protein